MALFEKNINVGGFYLWVTNIALFEKNIMYVVFISE